MRKPYSLHNQLIEGLEGGSGMQFRSYPGQGRGGISRKVMLLLALSRLLQVKVNIHPTPQSATWVMFQPIFNVAILFTSKPKGGPNPKI